MPHQSNWIKVHVDCINNGFFLVFIALTFSPSVSIDINIKGGKHSSQILFCYHYIFWSEISNYTYLFDLSLSKVSDSIGWNDLQRN